MWDDLELARLALAARLVYAFLTDSRQGDLLPGLVNLGAAGVAEGARIDPATVQVALADLEQAGRVEIDERFRLIRVVGYPHDPPCNWKHLRGWFARWRALPESSLKYRWIPALRATGAAKEWFAGEMAETFDTVLVPDGTDTHRRPNELGIDTQPIPSRSRSRSRSETDQDPDPEKISQRSDGTVSARVPVSPPPPTQGALFADGSGAPVQEAARRVRKPKAEPKPPADVTRVRDRVLELAPGYAWNGGEAAKAARLIQRHGLDAVLEMAGTLYGPSCPRWLVEGGRSLGTLLTQWNALADASRARASPGDIRVGQAPPSPPEAFAYTADEDLDHLFDEETTR